MIKIIIKKKIWTDKEEYNKINEILEETGKKVLSLQADRNRLTGDS